MTQLYIAALATFFAIPLAADWQLDSDQSTVYFITVKADHVAERHSFSSLSGTVTDAGATIAIDMASVDTLIPLRDERMREFLFKTAQFPTATLTASLDVAALLQNLSDSPTAALNTQVEGELSLMDSRLPVVMDITIAELSTTQILVATRAPVIVNAASVQLAAAVEKLRELAGLPSISQAVPVTFVLVFTQAAAPSTDS